jgi:exopolyphosphatase / guanosine-5'-triphosphate,3'-diphosphate pyrophosphatase
VVNRLTNTGSSRVEHGELRAADRATVAEQLGREPTIPFTIVARCTGGHPLVIRNAALDGEGAPFPTTHWLTCPEAVKRVSRLEADGWIARLNDRSDDDETFRAEVAAAHEEAAEDRAREFPEARAWGGVGGTRRGIKCLHAHYANHLAGGGDVVGRWVAGRIEPIHATQRMNRVAAIDQGTNSCRLLVLEPGADGSTEPTELARDMIITRLGSGVDRTGRFEPEALARTIAVIERYCRRARALSAESIRVAATSATRDAANREQLVAAVRRAAGSELEVITGQQEAALSFLGATRGLDARDGPFLVVDIGGGSTEFVFGRDPGITDNAISVQMGSVRLTERTIRSDPPAPDDLDRLRAAVGTGIEAAAAAVPVGEAATFVSVAGTATTIKAIALGLGRYDPDLTHRTWLSAAEAERVLAQLITMTNGERAAIPVMAPGRGDVIVAGAVILVEVMRRFGYERTLVSETDILDGLAFEALGVR